MSSLTAPRNVPQYNGNPIPEYTKAPMTANTIIWAGAMVQLASATGTCAPAASGTVGPILGVSDDTYDNSTTNSTGFPPPPGGIASKIKAGVFPMIDNGGGGGISLDSVGLPVFAVDDHTVDLTDGGGVRPFAGIVWDYDVLQPGVSGGSVPWILIGPMLSPQQAGGGAPATGSILSIPVTLATIAASTVGAFTPGFKGRILSAQFVTTTAATTGSKAATLQPQISGVATTGGALALTSANQTPVGAVVAGSPITALNEFSATDTISVAGSGITAFVEGAGVLLLTLEAA